jgi:hypothetical protein
MRILKPKRAWSALFPAESVGALSWESLVPEEKIEARAAGLDSPLQS